MSASFDQWSQRNANLTCLRICISEVDTPQVRHIELVYTSGRTEPLANMIDECIRLNRMHRNFGDAGYDELYNLVFGTYMPTLQKANVFVSILSDILEQRDEVTEIFDKLVRAELAYHPSSLFNDKTPESLIADVETDETLDLLKDWSFIEKTLSSGEWVLVRENQLTKANYTLSAYYHLISKLNRVLGEED